ncbi:hypothetical protein [Paraburkholderia bannensis]|nr:hypothetical protein [Paraburkholderia bannensis]
MTVDDDDKVTRAYAKKYADAEASEAFAASGTRDIEGNITERQT